MFTLTVFPDGRILLTTEDYLDEEQAKKALALFESWRSVDPPRPMLLSDCRVQHATSFDVDLEAGA